MANTTAGSFTSFGTTGSGSTTTIAHTAVAIGNVVMATTLNQDPSITVTSMTGGGVPSTGPSAWARVAGPFTSTSVNSQEIWAGTVSTTGSSPVVANWSASVSSSFIELDVQEFSSGLGTSTLWTRDGTQSGGLNNASSTNLTYPSLTPSGSGRLYFGHGYGQSTSATAGTTSGVVYTADTAVDQVVWSLNVSAVLQPIGKFTSAQPSGSIGVLMVPSAAGGGASPRGGFFPFMA